LLQQVLEKIAPVKRVEVFVDKQEAVVELENPAVRRRFFFFVHAKLTAILGSWKAAATNGGCGI